MKYTVYGKVVGTKFLGTFEAESPEEAEELALANGNYHISVCHQCSREVDDPEIESIIVEPA